MLVVDDQCLIAILGGETLPRFEHADDFATTFTWHYRAAPAVGSGPGTGALSRRFGRLTPSQQLEVTALMNDLPIGIGTVASRTVVPVMSVLSAISPANLLTLEAVATALVLDATIVTAVESTLLERTARAAHIDIVVVELK